MKNTLYIIETRNPNMEGAWESDTVGENNPRSFTQCATEVQAFESGECGQDFVEVFSNPENYRIAEVL